MIISFRRHQINRLSIHKRFITHGWSSATLAHGSLRRLRITAPPFVLSSLQLMTGLTRPFISSAARGCTTLNCASSRASHEVDAHGDRAAGDGHAVSAPSAEVAKETSHHRRNAEHPPYDMNYHAESSEALLREVFGPQAKLVVHRLTQRQFHHQLSSADADDGAQDTNSTENAFSSTAAQEPEDDGGRTYYRVSATFRLLGFPVELAVVKGMNAERAIENCVQQAIRSDVEFIRPSSSSSARDHQTSHSGGRPDHYQQRRRPGGPALSPHQRELKAIMDELRHLCMHFSRSIKFSIKPPSAALTNDPSRPSLWRCRAYMKDEWSAVAHTSLALESAAASPREALARCVAELRMEFREELASPAVMLESVREVEALVAPEGKTVTVKVEQDTEDSTGGRGGRDGEPPHRGEAESRLESSAATAPAERGECSGRSTVESQFALLQPSTYSATITVEDRHGNTRATHMRRQVSALAACQNAAIQVMRGESSGLPDAHLLGDGQLPVPLLLRLRWQLDLMVQCLSEALQAPPEQLVEVQVKALGATPAAAEADEAVFRQQGRLFTASLVAEGAVIWQTTGGGRYRVEFDAYVQAVTYMLDRYGDLVAACGLDKVEGGVLFPTTASLDEAVARHDYFPVLRLHKGRWNCYALLGTLTSQLMGSYYQTHYHLDRRSAEWCATLTVGNGATSSEAVLIQRHSKHKGEAWRQACLDALKENFPHPHAAVLQRYPDVDLSGDTMARGSKYRALPRAKRIVHIGNLFSLIAAFAEEDLGWRQLRIRLRNASGDLGLPQWVAEMEARVDGEDGRRVVAASPPYAQVRHARRVLLFHVARQYFPKELAIYAALPRGDNTDPDTDPTVRRTQIFQLGGPSFVVQLLALLEQQHPSMAPFTWALRRSASPNAEDAYVTDAAGTVEGDRDPEALLAPFAPCFHAEVRANNGDVLVTECDGGPEESGVGVLIRALKTASKHLGGADAELLWTELETHTPPAMMQPRELAAYLFSLFFGTPLGVGQTAEGSVSEAIASSTAGGATAAVAVEPIALGEYWFAFATLPRLAGLPIARTVGHSKRGSMNDALLLAARLSFPRMLSYWVKHDVAASALAADILSEPVVQTLPDAAVRDLQRQLSATPRPPTAFRLLTQLLHRTHRGERYLRVQQSEEAGNGIQYRLYLQHSKRLVRKGETQLVGFGAAMDAAAALHAASIMALENLFEKELREMEAAVPDYRTNPTPRFPKTWEHNVQHRC